MADEDWQCDIEVYQTDNGVIQKDTISAFSGVQGEEEDENADLYNIVNQGELGRLVIMGPLVTIILSTTLNTY